MKQVFVKQDCEVNSLISLDEEQAHHLFDVLRIQKRSRSRGKQRFKDLSCPSI